jgi:hypothetical protein
MTPDQAHALGMADNGQSAQDRLLDSLRERVKALEAKNAHYYDALRHVIQNAGGVAEPGVSMEFVLLAPLEVGRRIHALRIENDALWRGGAMLEAGITDKQREAFRAGAAWGFSANRTSATDYADAREDEVAARYPDVETTKGGL